MSTTVFPSTDVMVSSSLASATVFVTAVAEPSSFPNPITTGTGDEFVDIWPRIYNDGTVYFDRRYRDDSSMAVHFIYQLFFTVVVFSQLVYFFTRLRYASTKVFASLMFLGFSITSILISYAMTIGLQFGYDYDPYLAKPLAQDAAGAVRLVFYFVPEATILAAALLWIIPSSSKIARCFIAGVAIQAVLVLTSMGLSWGSLPNQVVARQGTNFSFCYAAQVLTVALAAVLIFLIFRVKARLNSDNTSDSMRSLRLYFVPALVLRLLFSGSIALAGGLRAFPAAPNYHVVLVFWDQIGGAALVVMIYVLTSFLTPLRKATSTQVSTISATQSLRTTTPEHPLVRDEKAGKAATFEGVVHMEKNNRAQKIKEELLANGADPTRSPCSEPESLPMYQA